MTTAAETIYNQIRAMDRMAMWDWGCVKNTPQVINDGETLLLKSSGMVFWKGYISITINRASDLYDVVFFRMRRPRKTASNPYPSQVKKIDNMVDGIFVEDLIATIDRQVLKR